MEMSAEELYKLSDGGKLSYDEVVARQRTKADWEARIAAEKVENRRKATERKRQVAARIAQDQRDRTRAGHEELFAKWLEYRRRRPTCFAEGMGKEALSKRLQLLGWSEERLVDKAIARRQLPPLGFEELFARWLKFRHPTDTEETMTKEATLKRLKLLGWSEERLKIEAFARGLLPRKGTKPTREMAQARVKVLEREYQNKVYGLKNTLNGRYKYSNLLCDIEAMERHLTQISELREKFGLPQEASSKYLSRHEGRVLLRAYKVVRRTHWDRSGQRNGDPSNFPHLSSRLPSKFRLRNILLGLLLFFVVSCTIAGIASGPLGGPNCDNDGIEDSNFWDDCPEPETP